MTQDERELCILIRTQWRLGYGMFVDDVEFKAWACNTYDLTEERLTQLMKESI